MAYKSDDMGMGAGEKTMDQGMPPETSEGGEHARVDVTSLIPPEMNVKDGEVLEFRVFREGDTIMAEYNYGKEGEDEGNESWEDDFRKHMSPREGGSEGEQEGY